MSSRYFLELVDARPGQPTCFALDPLPSEVGSGPQAEPRIDLARISRRHARFEASDGGLLVSDLDSTNGTFVNFERIEGPTLLRVGGTVHLADHEFTLHYGTAARMAYQQAISRTDANHTMVGFTAEPDQFPLQTPQFFELLNQEQVDGLRQPVKTVRGSLHGYRLLGRGSHPRLPASPDQLFELAEILGEEPRLSQIMRERCIAAAARAAMDLTLFLPVHPAELEDLELLSDQLAAARRQLPRSQLVVEVPVMAFDESLSLVELRQSLGPVEVALLAEDAELAKIEPLLDDPVSYLVVDEPGRGDLAELVGLARRQAVQTLALSIDSESELEQAQSLGFKLFSGRLAGAPEPIGD